MILTTILSSGSETLIAGSNALSAVCGRVIAFGGSLDRAFGTLPTTNVGCRVAICTTGNLVSRVPQGDDRREHALRDLIHDQPSIMPVHDLDPSYGRLFTIAKELNIPGVGFVDVLLADERGRLIMIECKLWRNPQARREVVGQILDYARELSRYSYEDLQRQISIASRRQGNVLYELARSAGSDLDEATFVDRVARDLSAGRFLLLVVGDGITEGAKRLGEYLADQPGLAFEFGLIEMAEYRYADAAGTERVIVQPRVLARTTVIERHVIRSEVAGLVVDPVTTAVPGRSSAAPPEGARTWRAFVERFVADVRFDDPGQPTPTMGGNGWIRVRLPGSFHLNLYRSEAEGGIGAQIRFSGAEGASVYDALLEDREAIDREFVEAGLPPPNWAASEPPLISFTEQLPPPWGEADEEVQRGWMASAANQFVNSFRPRLERLA